MLYPVAEACGSSAFPMATKPRRCTRARRTPSARHTASPVGTAPPESSSMTAIAGSAPLRSSRAEAERSGALRSERSGDAQLAHRAPRLSGTRRAQHWREVELELHDRPADCPRRAADRRASAATARSHSRLGRGLAAARRRKACGRGHNESLRVTADRRLCGPARTMTGPYGVILSPGRDSTCRSPCGDPATRRRRCQVKT
jgi:hypothetical protein